MSNRSLRSYAIDAGDSGTGPVGFVARIRARTREEALGLFDEQYQHGSFIEVPRDSFLDSIEYFTVYIGTITLDHVYDGECLACGGDIPEDQDHCSSCPEEEDDDDW